MQRPEAGWYPDPERPGRARYFDGDGWTSHVRDVAPAAATTDGLPPAAAPRAGPDGSTSDTGGGTSRGGGTPAQGRGTLLVVSVVLMLLVLAGSLFLGRLTDGGERPSASEAEQEDVGATPDEDVAFDDPGDAAPAGEAEGDAAGDDAVDGGTEPEQPAGPEQRDGAYDAPFELTIDPEASYHATIVTTSGDIVVELDPVGAPIATNNLVNLARDGYYDGVVFHRVIAGFVVQGGDPTGTGRGGPGYRFEDELDPAEELVAVEGGYPRGTLAMANAGPDTNGSQFFLVHGDLVQLPPAYTVFGRVTEGIEVVDAIAAMPTDGADRPTTDVTIATIEVTEGP